MSTMQCAQIDFKSPMLPDSGLAFDGFERMITASNLMEVIPALQAVEQAAQEGYYAVGFVAYEAAPAFDAALCAYPDSGDLPLLMFGLTREASKIDTSGQGEFQFGQWQPDWSQQKYETAFDTVMDQIKQGNTYQVNLTFPLRTEFYGEIQACYKHLRRAQSSNYCGFIQTNDFSVISSSPELFFAVHDGQIKTRPMKGTRPRGMTLEEDNKLKNELAASIKDQAENLMIVDLLRNDVGRIATKGSVREPELFTIEKYPTVWQMTSVVEADLADKTSLVDIFKALFPCGSVTGAPKVSTMRIINQLETAPRDVYCGAFGIVLPGGNCIFNVPIRTATVFPDKAVYRVGSGLVVDSLLTSEYQECLLKSNVLSTDIKEFELLETLSWYPDSGYYLLQEHLERAGESAEYFDFEWNDYAERLEFESRQWTHPMRVRLLFNKQGEMSVTAVPLPKENPLRRVKLASTPVNSKNPFLYHKTTNRKVYDQHRKQMGDADDILLFNERGELTESTIANVAVCFDGIWYTPPISSSLLAGTMRRHLLGTGKLQERIITIKDLMSAQKLKLMNSVRGLFDVELID
jgi:para-aminobenzoate synthetase / 4-amino-4-deoxychorismate lyase